MQKTRDVVFLLLFPSMNVVWKTGFACQAFTYYNEMETKAANSSGFFIQYLRFSIQNSFSFKMLYPYPALKKKN